MPGEVPSGWRPSTIGNIAVDSRERFDPADDVGPARPYVGLEHIEPGAAAVRRFGSSADVGSQKTLFRAGDILFGKLRPYLRKVAQVDREGVCSTDIIAIRPKQGTDARFLLTVLASEDLIRHATDTSAGTKMPRTSWEELAAFELPVPPLPEQKKIASILSSVDEAIQATQAVIEQTRRVKEGLLQDLLTRGLPGHTRFKQTEIGEIPEGWEVRSVGELLISCTYGVSCSLDTEPIGTPVLRMGNLQDGRLDLGDLKYADLSSWDREEVLLRGGDVVFNRTNSWDLVGKVALVPPDAPELGYASYLLRLRVDTAKADSAWLWMTMSGSAFQGAIKSIATKGVSQANVNPTKMRGLRLAVPPVGEQLAIVGRVQAADANSDLARGQLSLLRAMKSGLLQDLLTGRVRVAP